VRAIGMNRAELPGSYDSEHPRLAVTIGIQINGAADRGYDADFV
jgi:hypothetical protein